MKTHSGAKKRFKKTARGKWLHKKAGLSHLMAGMPSKHGRFLRRPGGIAKAGRKVLQRYMPYE